MATKGVIAAGHDLTAKAGAEILRAGGNSYDAVLACAVAATVTEPVLASAAGGGFLLAHPAEGKPLVYDFFVQTPRVKRPPEELDFQAIMADFGTTRQEFHIGMGAAAVPGQLKGIFEIHKDLGTMPMRDIVAPAVEYAKDGFRVNCYQSRLLQIVGAIFQTGPDLMKTYGSREKPGELVQKDETLRVPDLAGFWDMIAHEGPDEFYKGEIARMIEESMREGGMITRADLAAYRVERRAPLRLTFKDAQILTNPPPSSGGLLIGFGLKLLEGWRLHGLSPLSEEYLGIMAKVMAMTLEGRVAMQAMGDHGNPLLDPGFLKRYRDQVIAHHKAYRGTTHISVIDKDGNMAAMTVSNGEGGHFVIPGTGVIMNNIMGEEDVNPDGFHNWQPDTRMRSMMAPTTLVQGRHRAALGSGGSNRIRTAMLQVLVHLLEQQMPPPESVALPRIHLEPDCLYIEGGFDDDLKTLLAAYPDHQRFTEQSMFFGGVHIADLNAKTYGGSGDPRRDGVCLTL